MSATVDVLVVDDSALMRRVITHLLESEPRIRVIDTAQDGVDAVEKVVRLRPDVVTLDIEMPRMDGLQALQSIMQLMPTPVVVLSGLDSADVVFRALGFGAVDFVAKPSGTVSIDLHRIRDELIGKIRLAALVNLDHVLQPPLGADRRAIQPSRSLSAGSSPDSRWFVVIGASTGGPQAVTQVIEYIPPELPVSVLIAQHMPAGFTASFADRLDSVSGMHVVEGQEGQEVRVGSVYVAPGGRHMVLSGDRGHPFIRLQESVPEKAVRPSVDVLMRSVVEIAGSHTVGVLLTGMGSDGVAGLEEVRLAGGYTIAQDEPSCTVFGMPRVAIQRGIVDVVLSPAEIPAAIERAIVERTCDR